MNSTTAHVGVGASSSAASATATSATVTITRLIPLSPSFSNPDPDTAVYASAAASWSEVLSDETVLINVYQSTYRSTTQYVHSNLLLPLRSLTVNAVATNYLTAIWNSVGIAVGVVYTVYLYELYNGAICLLHLLFRLLPPWAVAKFLKLVGYVL